MKHPVLLCYPNLFGKHRVVGGYRILANVVCIAFLPPY